MISVGSYAGWSACMLLGLDVICQANWMRGEKAESDHDSTRSILWQVATIKVVYVFSLLRTSHICGNYGGDWNNSWRSRPNVGVLHHWNRTYHRDDCCILALNASLDAYLGDIFTDYFVSARDSPLMSGQSSEVKTVKWGLVSGKRKETQKLWIKCIEQHYFIRLRHNKARQNYGKQTKKKQHDLFLPNSTLSQRGHYQSISTP